MPQTQTKFELRVLGGAGLHAVGGGEVHSVLAQPKRFALLVYLALGGVLRMHRRDALLGLFWPESDAERAGRVAHEPAFPEALAGRGGD
jgi:DNA-binding SARP family transcriptional activator